MKEVITHDELCERIGNCLKLYDAATVLEICKIVFEQDEVQVKYLGDSDYSWEQKQDL